MGPCQGSPLECFKDYFAVALPTGNNDIVAKAHFYKNNIIIQGRGAPISNDFGSFFFKMRFSLLIGAKLL